MAGNGSSPKPWEQTGSSSGPAPFKPASAGSTSEVVEASGTVTPGKKVTSTSKSAGKNTNTLTRHVPSRPWVQNYGGYGSMTNYNSGYSCGMTGVSGMYGGSYGGSGGLYGGGMYGNNMYTGGYCGLYGGSPGMYASSGMYGGGIYNSGMGGPMGAYCMGGPSGGQDPNNPYGAPPSPPRFWVSLLGVMHGLVNFFGRFSILMDQNTHALHLFLTSLLQLFDRSGHLYGELARFVLRILGIRTKPKIGPPQGPDGLPFPDPNTPENQNYIEGPSAAPSGSWENAWGNYASK